ncbi:MAG: hypothetical protein JWO83_1467 [Caulobacteraceae bacterium]|jgi:hypothetical protein|nr:hypothetical protein [Caulobacteraceae bacterium]
MKPALHVSLLGVFACVCIALPAHAADRVRAGQWTGTTTAAGKTYNSSSCMTSTDAGAMNGDAASIRGYLEKTIPPTICKISNIRTDGAKVTYTTFCAGGPATVITSVYHGDSFETVDTKGTKSSGKRLGPCR